MYKQTQVDVDPSELTDMTVPVNSPEDELVLLDNGHKDVNLFRNWIKCI